MALLIKYDFPVRCLPTMAIIDIGVSIAPFKQKYEEFVLLEDLL